MKTVVLLLSVLACASAMESLFWGGDYADDKGELGKGCCLPEQWEGRVGAFHISKRFVRPKFRASDSKIGLDFSGKKVAARSLYYCKKTKRTYETRTVADFNAKKVYFIFKDKCKSFNIRSSLRKPCIPDFFKRFPSYSYGAGSDSLAVTAFGYRNASRARTTEIFSVVTSGSCVPVKGAYRVKRGFRSSMGKYQYYNVTPGNQDRGLYTVPDFCNSDSNSSETETTGSRRLWRKFKKYVSNKKDSQEFNADSELATLPETDLLTQTMDLIDGSMELATGDDYGHQHWPRGRRNKGRHGGRHGRWRFRWGSEEEPEAEPEDA